MLFSDRLPIKVEAFRDRRLCPARLPMREHVQQSHHVETRPSLLPSGPPDGRRELNRDYDPPTDDAPLSLQGEIRGAPKWDCVKDTHPDVGNS